jgi:hypothetical protein
MGKLKAGEATEAELRAHYTRVTRGQSTPKPVQAVKVIRSIRDK